MNIRSKLASLCTLTVLCSVAQAGVLRVSQNAPGPTHNGATWPTAFLSIADAVAAAQVGDELWVAQGQYIHTDIDIQMDMSFYGGFAGTETERSQRNPSANPTIVQEERSNYGALAFQGTVGLDTVVDGFVFPTYIGIFTNGSSPTIIHNAFRDGVAAVNNWGGSPRFLHNTVSNMSYCALGLAGGNPLVQGNLITGSAAGVLCGALLGGPSGGLHIIVGNTFAGVNPAIDVDAVSCYIADNLSIGSPIIVRQGPSIVVNNTVVGPGAGLLIPSSNWGDTVANNVVAFTNSGVTALYGDSTSNATSLFNNCVYGTTGKAYTNIKDPTGFQGNISVDPQFVNRNGDFHLAATSPLINTGNDTYVLYDYPDLDGHLRVQGAHVDIGAYEFGGSAITMGDVAGALRLWGGISSATPDMVTRLNLEAGAGVDLQDAVRLARKAAGLN